MGTLILAAIWALSLFGVAAFEGLSSSLAFWLYVFIVLTFVIGWLPIWIALIRKHHKSGAIMILNLAFDWTIIGWIAAFVLSLTKARDN